MPRPITMTQTPTSERDPFLDALYQGQASAPTRLYSDHVQMVRRVVRRVVGPTSEVEDIVQEVFLHAVRGVRGFRGVRGQLSGWLKQMAIKRAQKHLRHQRVRRWLRLTPAGELPMVSAMGSQETALAMRRAYNILTSLPSKEQAAFTLRFFEQMTIPEIAEATGSSASTVKRRIERARAVFVSRAREDAALSEWLPQGGLE